MKTRFRKSFARDLKKVKDAAVAKRIRAIIAQVEAARQLGDLAGVKKLSGSSQVYRIRVGDYRLGVVLDEDVVEFVRCLHRRDIYRHFP